MLDFNLPLPFTKWTNVGHTQQHIHFASSLCIIWVYYLLFRPPLSFIPLSLPLTRSQAATPLTPFSSFLSLSYLISFCLFPPILSRSLSAVSRYASVFSSGTEREKNTQHDHERWRVAAEVKVELCVCDLQPQLPHLYLYPYPNLGTISLENRHNIKCFTHTHTRTHTPFSEAVVDDELLNTEWCRAAQLTWITLAVFSALSFFSFVILFPCLSSSHPSFFSFCPSFSSLLFYAILFSVYLFCLHFFIVELYLCFHFIQLIISLMVHLQLVVTDL